MTPRADNSSWTGSALERWGLLAVLALTVAAYAPSLGGEFLWDDDAVYGNPYLIAAGGLRGIWLEPRGIPHESHYWPVTYTSFWLEAKLWGMRPLGFRATNLALHLLNVALLVSLLRRLRIPGATLAGAVFALHPVHAESVAWIIERKDVLGGFLAFVSFHCWLAWRGRGGVWLYTAGLVAFALGLLSKSAVLPLPVVMLAVMVWREREEAKRTALSLIPFGLVGAGITAHDLWFVSRADPFELTDPVVWRVMRGLGFQAGKAAWPGPLGAIYPQWTFDGPPLTAVACGIFGVAAGVLLVRSGGGRAVLCAAAVYALFLSPTLGFIPFSFLEHAPAADRFQYLALAGPAAVAGAFASLVSGRFGRAGRAFGWIGAVALAVSLVQVTPLYQDNDRLFGRALAVNPKSWIALHNHAEAMSSRGEIQRAVAGYLEALAVRPNAAETCNNLAVLLVRQGDLTEAEKLYRKAVAIRPDYAEARVNLGLALARMERLEEAVGEFDAALVINPHLWDGHYNRGVALVKLQRLEQAAEAFMRAHVLNPRNAAVLSNLGHVEMQIGRMDEAIKHLSGALELDPGQTAARETLRQLSGNTGATPGLP